MNTLTCTSKHTYFCQHGQKRKTKSETPSPPVPSRTRGEIDVRVLTSDLRHCIKVSFIHHVVVVCFSIATDCYNTHLVNLKYFMPFSEISKGFSLKVFMEVSETTTIHISLPVSPNIRSRGGFSQGSTSQITNQLTCFTLLWFRQPCNVREVMNVLSVNH